MQTYEFLPDFDKHPWRLNMKDLVSPWGRIAFCAAFLFSFPIWAQSLSNERTLRLEGNQTTVRLWDELAPNGAVTQYYEIQREGIRHRRVADLHH